MDIVLNRRGGVPVREQIATQLQLKILGGELAHGQRLPSVRALARRLRVHHNTVSAAYQDLQAAGHVQLKRGSGVFVRRAGPTELPEARGLDEMIRLALRSALTLGHTGTEIRAAVPSISDRIVFLVADVEATAGDHWTLDDEALRKLVKAAVTGAEP